MLRLLLVLGIAFATLAGCEKPNPKPGRPIAPQPPGATHISLPSPAGMGANAYIATRNATSG